MAGSFDLFRKYQRAMLAGVAILAMLAFFVLPPFLQMAPDVGGADPQVATWIGGGVSEGDLQRGVAMRMVLNEFLRDAIAASGRDPGDTQPLGEDEADVVRTLVLAREAEANGIFIGNGVVNQFLAQWTNNMVRPEQLEALISGRRLGQMNVTTGDMFEALRTILKAERMRQFAFAGFAGEPPGARWDIYRRLEQAATIEIVPVVVESLADDVPAPAESDLRGFYERHKDSLPVDRSPDPGFKEPHRISYDWVVADVEALAAAAEKDVTDADIAKFYEENKVRLYRTKQAADLGAEKTEAVRDSEPPVQESSGGAATGATDDPPAAAPPADPKAALERRGPFRPVKLRQPQQEPPASTPGPDTDTKAPAAENPAGPASPADAAESPAAPAAAEGIEPLEKVRDDVRKRLAAGAVTRRLDELFRVIAADVAGFSRDVSRWKADGGSEATRPVPPSAEKIAERQGLRAGQALKRTAGEAVRDGGVGASFQVALDPRSPLGFRQAGWADLFFGTDRPLWRPVETRDIEGDRYLAWKTEDLPAFVPDFDAVRGDVERAWRIVEARPLARKLAAEVAACAAGGRPLAECLEGRAGPKLDVATVGPFTWLASDAAAIGSPAAVSQPDGLAMPGEEFMRSVFDLEPGGTAVAFNEPQTVCYAIRLVSYAPSEEELRAGFLNPANDQRRIAAILQQEQARAFEAWLAGVEKRAGLEWKRPPQPR